MVAPKGETRVLLGRIADAHGTRGEVLIHVYTEPPANIAAYGPLTDATGTRAFAIECPRVTAKGVLARLSGVTDRSAAQALKGVNLYVVRARLPRAKEGEFYHADLMGLVVVNRVGKPIGEVVAVQNYGAGDLLEVRLSGRGRTELIPFTEAFVPEVDLAARRAVVILPSAPADGET